MTQLRGPRLGRALGEIFPLDGRCAETDPEAFFPEKGETPKAAKQICQRCEVQPECLEWALRTDQKYGVWGGFSETERRAHKKTLVRS